MKDCVISRPTVQEKLAFLGLHLFIPVSTKLVNAALHKCHLTFRNIHIQNTVILIRQTAPSLK